MGIFSEIVVFLVLNYFIELYIVHKTTKATY